MEPPQINTGVVVGIVASFFFFFFNIISVIVSRPQTFG